MTFLAVLRAVVARLSASGVLLLAVALGCQSDERPIGGETHFLVCESDSECRQLSDEHICVDDVCQLPAPLPLADAGAPDAGGCAQSSVLSSETVLLGDSFFATSHEIAARLSELAIEAGVLEPEQSYRDYSRLVGNALAIGGNGIEAQYDEAVLEGAVGAVVMNGGGADVLIGTCETVDAQCPLLSDAASAAADLFERMSQAGVQEVLYVFYPDPTDPEVRAEMDALRPLVQEVCEQAPLACHFVDLRETFEGRYAEFIEADGLNPTTAGADATAQEIWRVMRESCLVP